MTLEQALGLGIACCAIVLVLVSRAGALTVVLLTLTLASLGLFILAGRGEAHLSTAMLFAGSAVLAATFVVIGGRVGAARARRVMEPISDGTVFAVCWTVIALTVYHFAVSGIPLFSHQIETSRFDLDSSGLFGIPGRAYEYGVPLALTLAAANASAQAVRWMSYTAFRLMLAVSVTTSVMSGFKGALIELAFSLIIMHSAIGRRGRTVRQMLSRYWIFGAASVAFIFAVATQYQTYARQSGSLLDDILERASIGGARPIAYVMESGHGWWPYGNPQLHDLVYFAEKYVGIASSQQGFTRTASAHMWGTSLSSGQWAPPVTLSGFGEFYFAFGATLALVVCAALGFLLGYVERRPKHTVCQVVVDVAVASALVDTLYKGGVAFLMLNAVVTAVVFVSFVHILIGVSRRRPIRLAAAS